MSGSQNTGNNGIGASLTVEELDCLLACRAFIARLGESDLYSWWRTDGLLGPDADFVGQRVLPETHPVARLRIVSTVAGQACIERFPGHQYVTLFNFGAAVEDQFDAYLLERLADSAFWSDLMTNLRNIDLSVELRDSLVAAGLISQGDAEAVKSLQLGPAGRSLCVPEGRDLIGSIRNLTAAFAASSRGALAVPYLESIN